ncbi:glycosyltransferase [Yokenella regensburgei]|uniref:glycosyltransferase n=1 Tax=Yokenella regensburgei TaxID=158877 RepID=UPI0027D97CE6|nr:glycosyltransferase [Yokenella regensburgei]MDQ4429040.1 glycosyltransferase [Yokenella regensburgei]
MTLLVNHVMSSGVESGIFEDLLGYYNRFCDNDIRIIKSETPVFNADLYHYHRPHLEKKLRKNSIVTVHHDLNDTDDWLQYEKFHDRYAESKLILCLNQAQQDYLFSKGIYHTKIVPHGYNSDVFRYDYDSKCLGDKLTIGFLSKRYDRKVKGDAYLWELMNRLDSRFIQFVFVGEGRSITSQKAMSLGFDVRCYERLPYCCFGDLYRKLNFLLVTSLFEGGPANIPEAIFSATPIITTPVGMARDYVKDNINGIILTGNADIDSERIGFYAKKNNYLSLLKGADEMKNSAMSWREVMKLTSMHYKMID